MPLVAVLVHRAGVDELALVSAVKRHVRVVIADPAQVTHDPEAMRQISRDVCWRLRVMPLALEVYNTGTKVLRLAMADPTDAVAIAEVEHITGCQVENRLMPLSAVEELVETAYRAYVTEVMPRERMGVGDAPKTSSPSSPSPSSSIVREIEADSAKTARLSTKDSTSPTTVPYHRVTDQASLEVRHQALLRILLQKEILSEDEYREQVRLLMKQRVDDA